MVGEKDLGEWDLGIISSLTSWLSRSLMGLTTRYLPYCTGTVIGCEDTVNQGILPEKAALPMTRSEDYRKLLLLFEIFFKVIFLTVF